MKKSAVLRYPLGHERFKTPTVREMRRALRAFPPDMPVCATWETTIQPVCSIAIEHLPPNAIQGGIAVVMLDVEDH